MGAADLDAITTRIIMSRLQSAAEEIWATLVHAAFSINIKERHDCSAAIFNSMGEVVSMPDRATVPIHLSSLDGVVQAVLHRFPREDLRPGDMFIANDPYIPGGGGSHLPDYTVVAPVFGKSGRIVAFVANLGHHSDIGGPVPGSHAVHLPTIFHEGLRLPPVRIVRHGELQEDIIDLISLNSRLPEERVGDLHAQVAGNLAGVRGVVETCDRFGEELVKAALDELLNYSERRLRAILRALPDGEFESADYFDDDGINNNPLRIQLRLMKKGDTLQLDFAGTSVQVPTAINVPIVGTRATVFCVVKTLLDPELPPNAGFHRVVAIDAPAGSLLNALPPAAVGERSSTCQVVGDVVAGAIGQLVPMESSAGCGSLLGYRISGIDPRKQQYYVEYQAFAGGHGAAAYSDGMDSVRVWASGAANAPVEADEMAYPVLVHRYELRTGSGGPGRFRGGLGIRRVFVVNGEEPRMSTSGTRMRIPPPGLFGGESGQPAMIVINPGTRQEQHLTRMVTEHKLSRGDVIEILTAGGGGWGQRSQRDTSLIERDLKEEKVVPSS